MIRVICVVAGDRAGADTIVAVLDDCAVGTPAAVRVLRAPDPLLGSAFWRARWREARDWWESAVGADASDVLVVIDHAPGLDAEVRGTSGRWAVWCASSEELASYQGAPNVLALVARDAQEFAEALIEAVGSLAGETPLFRATWGPFQRATQGANGERGQPEVGARPGPHLASRRPADFELQPCGQPTALEQARVLDDRPDQATSAAEFGVVDAVAPWGPRLDGLVDIEENVVDEQRFVGAGSADTVGPTGDASAALHPRGSFAVIDVAAGLHDASEVDWGKETLSDLSGEPELRAPRPMPAQPVDDDDDPDVAGSEAMLSGPRLEAPLAVLAALRPLDSETEEDEDSTAEARCGHKTDGHAEKHMRTPTRNGVLRRLRPRWSRAVRSLPPAKDEVHAGNIGQRLMRAHSTVLLSCSPKGGVAKTNDVIGVSELAAQAVEAFAIDTGLLDMNLVNPDIREALGLDAGIPTARDLVRSLAAGIEPPAGVSPVDSNLRVYVGEADPGGFTRGEIDRVAEWTRTRWALTAVDLANCLPDAAGSDAAAVLTWWLRHADVLMVPIDPTPLAFRGATRLLETVREQVEAGVIERMPGVVMPMLIRPDGEAARDDRIGELVRRFEADGARIVIVPSSEEVQLASWPWRDTSIVAADETVRRAYWEILHAALDVRGS